MLKISLTSFDVFGVVWCNVVSCLFVVLVGFLVVIVKLVIFCFIDMWNFVDRLIMIDSFYW